MELTEGGGPDRRDTEAMTVHGLGPRRPQTISRPPPRSEPEGIVDDRYPTNPVRVERVLGSIAKTGLGLAAAAALMGTSTTAIGLAFLVGAAGGIVRASWAREHGDALMRE